jgi:hypothetical protein
MLIIWLSDRLGLCEEDVEIEGALAIAIVYFMNEIVA